MFVEPIKKLGNDVEKLKLTLENWDDTNTQGFTITDDSQKTHEMINKFLLVDAINKLIVEYEHIKLFLSKPKESKYIPIFVNNAQIKYVYFSPAIPNIFVVDPIPICDLKQCYLFVKQGFGNDTKMFQKSYCIKIIQDEYFCKNKKCALHVLTYGMNINLSVWERTNDVRFNQQSMIN